MKQFCLISLIIISIIKCEIRTPNINNKACSTDLKNVESCDLLYYSSQSICEYHGCCYYDNERHPITNRRIKCFRPSCIDGCQNCDDLNTCKICKDSYYITEDTKQCYKDTVNYYYRDGDILKRCHSNCLKCSSSPEDNIQNQIYDSITIDMKCTECKQNYYKLDGTNNCYDNTLEQEGFYLKDKIYYPCETNCLTCSDKNNGGSNNCRSCDYSKGLYLVEDLKNCEPLNYSGYYLKDNILKKCYESCKECNESESYENNGMDTMGKHNCIECKDNYYRFGESNCYKNDTSLDGYFLDTDADPYIWKKCYERCQTCNTSGNFTNMNCLSCRTDLFDPIKSKPYKLTLTTRANCVEGCSNDLYLTLEGDCVTNCSFGFYKYSFNHTCLSECPHNYEPNSEQTKCIIKSIDQETSSDEFKSQVPENILEFVNSSSLYNGSNFLAVVLSFSDTDPKEQVKKGISAVDLGDCEFKLKDYYNISYNESLIILNMESKRNETKNEEKK